jgi:hypothetical protein
MAGRLAGAAQRGAGEDEILKITMAALDAATQYAKRPRA